MLLYTQAFTYDPFGNRKIDAAQTSGTNINNKVYEPNKRNNRLNGLVYDAAGNVINDSYTFRQNDRKYDAENRMTQAAGTNGAANYYVYDGDGRRVRRIVNGTEMWQVYGIDGELLAEYAAGAAATTPQKEYGYRGGQLLITAESNGQVKWLVSDHLGTPRIIVDASGSLSSIKRHDYLPFGEELTPAMAGGGARSSNNGYVTDTVRQKFTRKERDAETGLDFFEARYFSSIQGRFTSPDEFNGGPIEVFGEVASSNPTFYADLTNPQSLNKYQYTYNNPLSYTDPNGHCPDCSPVAAAAAGKEFPNSPSLGVFGDYIKGYGKEGLNVLIDMNNIGAQMLNRPDGMVERYQPSNEAQALGMRRATQFMILSPALGKAGPANVMMAEAGETAAAATVIQGSPKVQAIMGEIKKQNIRLAATIEINNLNQ